MLASAECAPEPANEDQVCYRFVESDSSLSVDRECAAGLKCVSDSDAIGFDVTRVCKPALWCLNPGLAASQCDGLPHPLVLGNWSCGANNQCVWQAAEPAP